MTGKPVRIDGHELARVVYLEAKATLKPRTFRQRLRLIRRAFTP